MRVLLVDNRTLFVEGLQNLLHTYGVEVAGIAPLGEEAITQTSLLKPDVIIINILGDEFAKLNIIYQIKITFPSTRIIAFTDCHENLLKAVQYGAAGFLLSDIKGDELLRQLKNT